MRPNAASEKSVKEQTDKQKRQQEIEHNDLIFLLGSQQGRRFVWRLLEECGIYRSSWRLSAEIHFLEGQRNIGLKLLKDVMQASPDAYLQMIKENQGES